MSGRTPEYLGMKITGRDVKLVMVAFLIHPLIILIPTVIAYASGAVSAIGMGGNSVGYTQVLWEFTSAAANNGSDFLGCLSQHAVLQHSNRHSHSHWTICSNCNIVGAFRINDWQKTRRHNLGSKN